MQGQQGVKFFVQEQCGFMDVKLRHNEYRNLNLYKTLFMVKLSNVGGSNQLCPVRTVEDDQCGWLIFINRGSKLVCEGFNQH